MPGPQPVAVAIGYYHFRTADRLGVFGFVTHTRELALPCLKCTARFVTSAGSAHTAGFVSPNSAAPRRCFAAPTNRPRPGRNSHYLEGLGAVKFGHRKGALIRIGAMEHGLSPLRLGNAPQPLQNRLGFRVANPEHARLNPMDQLANGTVKPWSLGNLEFRAMNFRLEIANRDRQHRVN